MTEEERLAGISAFIISRNIVRKRMRELQKIHSRSYDLDMVLNFLYDAQEKWLKDYEPEKIEMGK